MAQRLAGLFDLTGRVAVITGGSRGLGLQVARGLGEYGAAIALVARDAQELAAATAELAAEGITAQGFPADIARADAAEPLAAAILAKFSRIDILINNAGTTWGAPAQDYPLAGWQKIMDLNVTGLFLLTQAVARLAFLPQRKGAVLNIASIEGLMGHHPDRIGTIGYNTAKGAVINLTRALAAEWGPKGIRVNALAPGFFPSKMTRLTMEQHGADLLAVTPLGKLGGADDLMGPALLLVSDAGGHITGQVLAIDGGASVI